MKPAQQVRRPLTGIALAVAGGLWFAYSAARPPVLLLAVCAFVLSACCLWRSSAGLYLAVGLLAAVWGGLSDPGSAILLHAEGNPDVQWTGTVADDPVTVSGQCRFRLDAESIGIDGQRYSCRRPVRVYLKKSGVLPEYGQRVVLSGRYTGFGRYASGADGSVSATGCSVLDDSPNVSWVGLCYRLRQKSARILSVGMENFSESTRLLHALLLGFRQSLPGDLYEMFALTGTLHIFAISGLHVGVVAAILVAVLKAIGIPRPRWGLFLIPALLLYVTATGMKASALRAFTMAAVYFSAPLFKRKADVPSAVALAAILLLIISPRQIQDAGFLLSFTVVSGIVMVHGFVVRQLHRPAVSGWAAPLYLPGGTRPVSKVARSAGLLLITSLAAWSFSLPLTAWFFNTLSLVAPVGSLAVIPLTFMVVLTGCLSIGTGWMLPQGAILFNHANRIFTGLLCGLINWFGGIPGSWYFVRKPPLSSVCLWYGGLAVFFMTPVRIRKYGLLLILLSLCFWICGPGSLSEEIHLFPQSDSATLVRLSRRGWVLVTDGNPFYTERTVRLLKQHGVNRLQSLVVSGPHADPVAINRLCRLFDPASVSTAESSGDGRVLVAP
ncbi:MAG: ComEC/Rec2 family competence protein [Kiritimatiellales bacterium]